MNKKKSLILMVEDEEQVLNTNCRMLRRRGYDVCTAQTVSEVYHQFEEQLPDLLILDIMLPERARNEWKEMYDTYLDTINGIRMMDGCSLTEGSHT